MDAVYAVYEHLSVLLASVPFAFLIDRMAQYRAARTVLCAGPGHTRYSVGDVFKPSGATATSHVAMASGCPIFSSVSKPFCDVPAILQD